MSSIYTGEKNGGHVERLAAIGLRITTRDKSWTERSMHDTHNCPKIFKKNKIQGEHTGYNQSINQSIFVYFRHENKQANRIQ